MKQLLIWFFAFYNLTFSFAQEQSVFEQENLSLILPKIEAFYDIQFSYTDVLIANKKVSIVLDNIISLEAITQTLSSQTSLKFEVIGSRNIVISSFSQVEKITICGQLLVNNEPIENATLQIGDRFYNSNVKGDFLIENVPYNSVIYISSFGVEKKIIEASNHIAPTSKIIVLKEKIEQLDQVVIQDYLTGGITKNVRQTTISTKKLKVLPGLIEPDVLESIHQFPGVSNVSETVSSIHVRGGNADQNLIIWNNIKTYNNSHLFGTISAFNPYVVSKVNFINKGTSAQYGEKISSVIDISSNYKPGKKIKGGAGFNLLHADAFIDIPVVKNKLAVQLSGRRSYADAFKTPTFKNYEKRIFQNTTVFDSNLSINESKNISWFYDYTINAVWNANSKNQFVYNQLYTKDYLNFSALNASENNLYIDALNTKNQGYNLGWKKEWNDKLSHQVDAYLSDYQLDYLFTDQTILGTSASSKRNGIQDFGFNLNMKYEIKNFKQFNFGYQHTQKKITHNLQENPLTTASNIDYANVTTSGNSLFAEYQVNKPQSHLYNLGLRVNKYGSSSTYYVEPRVLLQKFVTDEFSINASLEYKSQFVSQIEQSVINNAALENSIWVNVEAKDLPILNSYQYTIGGNYSKNNWVIDLEAYFKKTNNISSLQFNFDTLNELEYDIGKSSVQGIDIFIKKKYKNYHTWFSYTFNSTNYIFENLNDNKPFSSNVNINNTIKWSHFYKHKNVKFALGWIWRTGKPYTEIISNTDPLINSSNNFGKLNESNLPIYHRLDFSVLYDFKIKRNSETKYSLGLSVLNIYNRKNTLNRDVRFRNNQLNTNIIEASQITPNIVFRVFW